MINSLELPNLAKCRVWIDEWPDAHLGNVDLESFSVSAAGRRRTKGYGVAVEWWAPSGPRVRYGLLGGSFEPHGDDSLKVCLREGSEERIYNSGFPTVYGERILVGLPTEYVGGALEGIRSTCAIPAEVPPGRLVLRVAAHGEVGSSWKVFNVLGIVLGRTWLTHEAPNPHDVAELLLDEVAKSLAG